jgi:hypothetical protein
MTASVSMSVFHQWLLADPAGASPACAIVIHIADSRPCELLIQEITEYLNEYDDDADGRWLPATPDLLAKVAGDPNHRRLLGLRDMQEDTQPGPEGELQRLLGALGQRGHVVFRAPGASDESLGLANAFHAGVGSPGEITAPCHLVLNPELMDQRCIAHVIADVFLEWLHYDRQRNSPIRTIR